MSMIAPRLLAASFIFLAPVAGSAQLVVDVEGAQFRPFPVAVPAVSALTANKRHRAVASRLTQGLQRGVALVRALELVPPKSYVASKNEPWTQPNYRDWQNVGASGLIRGAVEVEGESVKVGLRFYDVTGQREFMTRSYTLPKPRIHRAVHRFLDDLVQELTGEPGIFGTKITYVRRTPKGKVVHVMNVDGTDDEGLTAADALSLLPAFDPTGRYLVLTSYLKGNPDLYRLDRKTGELKWLSRKQGLNTGGAVSPDGKRIALTLSLDGNTEIYVMDWGGGNLRRLTDSWGQDVSPSWSPDGKRLAFVSSRSGQPHIYVMNADGGQPRRLTFQGTYNQEPDWSPRAGGQIVFTARDEFLKYDIFLVHPETGEITRLTQDEGNNESPAFAPDGQHIVFTSTRNRRQGRQLYVMDVEGRNQRRISRKNGDFETPSWGPRMGYEP